MEHLPEQPPDQEHMRQRIEQVADREAAELIESMGASHFAPEEQAFLKIAWTEKQNTKTDISWDELGRRFGSTGMHAKIALKQLQHTCAKSNIPLPIHAENVSGPSLSDIPPPSALYRTVMHKRHFEEYTEQCEKLLQLLMSEKYAKLHGLPTLPEVFDRVRLYSSKEKICERLQLNYTQLAQAISRCATAMQRLDTSWQMGFCSGGIALIEPKSWKPRPLEDQFVESSQASTKNRMAAVIENEASEAAPVSEIHPSLILSEHEQRCFEEIVIDVREIWIGKDTTHADAILHVLTQNIASGNPCLQAEEIMERANITTMEEFVKACAKACESIPVNWRITNEGGYRLSYTKKHALKSQQYAPDCPPLSTDELCFAANYRFFEGGEDGHILRRALSVLIQHALVSRNFLSFDELMKRAGLQQINPKYVRRALKSNVYGKRWEIEVLPNCKGFRLVPHPAFVATNPDRFPLRTPLPQHASVKSSPSKREKKLRSEERKLQPYEKDDMHRKEIESRHRKSLEEKVLAWAQKAEREFFAGQKNHPTYVHEYRHGLIVAAIEAKHKKMNVKIVVKELMKQFCEMRETEKKATDHIDMRDTYGQGRQLGRAKSTMRKGYYWIEFSNGEEKKFPHNGMMERAPRERMSDLLGRTGEPDQPV